MAYSDKVIDHYENPRNVGSFEKDDPTVGTGMVGAHVPEPVHNKTHKRAHQDKYLYEKQVWFK